jgi:hypothetical protein
MTGDNGFHAADERVEIVHVGCSGYLVINTGRRPGGTVQKHPYKTSISKHLWTI